MVERGEGPAPPKKPRVEKQEGSSSPVTVAASRDRALALPDLGSVEETGADEFAMEKGLACVVCR